MIICEDDGFIRIHMVVFSVECSCSCPATREVGDPMVTGLGPGTGKTKGI
jgi:hypothetical protein